MGEGMSDTNGKMFLISEELRDKVVALMLADNWDLSDTEVYNALRNLTPAEPVAGMTGLLTADDREPIYEGDEISIHQFNHEGGDVRPEVQGVVEYVSDRAAFGIRVTVPRKRDDIDVGEWVPFTHFYGLHEESFTVVKRALHLPAPKPVDLSVKAIVRWLEDDGWTTGNLMIMADSFKRLHAHLTAQAAPQVVGSCGWSQDEWSESWSAGCGCEWVFPDGGPAENGMKFCPSCGKPVSLPAPPTKGASRDPS